MKNVFRIHKELFSDEKSVSLLGNLNKIRAYPEKVTSIVANTRFLYNIVVAANSAVFVYLNSVYSSNFCVTDVSPKVSPSCRPW